MPSAVQYDPENRELRQVARQELESRQRHHAKNWRYYEGSHPLHLKRGDDGSNDNIVINLCRQAIDRTVAFLVPDFPNLELDDSADTDDERWLREVWRSTGGAVLLGNMALNGALDGHVFARVVMDEPLPRVLNLNGVNVLPFWDADDYQQVLWYEIHWQVGRIGYRQDVVNDDGRWIVRDFRMVGNRWELQDEIIWAYRLSPIVEWQHLPNPVGFYGRDELPHAELNDAINRVASDVSRILRFHAYPRTIGTGFEAGTVQATAIDDFWTIPNENARVFNLEMESDLGASMRFLQTLTEAFLGESRVNILNGDPQNVKGVTNLAIRALYMDMIAKNEVLRRHYGRGIQALSQRLLMLGGRRFDVIPTVHWGDALPMDQREAVEIVARQVDVGVLSKETAATKLGLDAERELSKMGEET